MKRVDAGAAAICACVVALGLWMVWVIATHIVPEGDIEPIDLYPSEGRVMGLPAAPDCWHLYDNEQSIEWWDCMGVGLKSSREPVVPEGGEVVRVVAKFIIFDSERALQYALKTRGGCRDCDTTEGISNCKRDLDEGIAECLIMVVRPKKVDDNATRVIGHEIMHGIYGRYHNE